MGSARTVELYGAQKIFAFGEVHGTNEIGIVSSLAFDELASKKLVNVVAFEMPMDIEESLQRYVDTGSDPTANQLLAYFAKNMFGSILTRSAREQFVKGNPIKVGAVDIPRDPQFAVNQIFAERHHEGEDVLRSHHRQQDADLHGAHAGRV